MDKMSVILRALSIVAVLVAGLAGVRSGGHALATSSPDTRLLRQAALRLVHHAPTHVVSWLRRQSGVRTAAVGGDGVTLDVHFADGLHAAVLPRAMRTVRLGPAPQSRAMAQPHQTGGARAAVWEPFATELGL